MAGGTFTWAKSFDTSSSSFASDNYSNNPSAITPWFDTSLNRGLSDFNVTKNLTFNMLYTVPTPASFNGILKSIAGGWGIGANFEAADGIPLWPLIVNDALGMYGGGAYDIPDLAPGCQQISPNYRQTLQYLNTSCYTIPNAPSQAFFNGSGGSPTSPGFNPGCDKGTEYQNYIAPTSTKGGLGFTGSTLACFNLLGNDPRNAVDGPGLINLDFSITKDTHIRKISETANLQFRAEFFNIANHPNYQFPVANHLSPIDQTGAAIPAFGQLTTTQAPERQIQFALKFIY